MSKPKMNPCPFLGCGSDDTEIMTSFQGNKYVLCRSCWAEGPVAIRKKSTSDDDVEIHAIELWNSFDGEHRVFGEISSCPFAACGSSRVSVHESNCGGRFVVCEDCEAQGPFVDEDDLSEDDDWGTDIQMMCDRAIDLWGCF